MAKDKNVRLGDKASSFYDPTSKLKLVPGKYVTLTPELKKSKRVQKALKSGHIQVADADDIEELGLELMTLKTKPKKDKKPKNNDGDDTLDLEAVTYEEKKLKAYKQAQLVEIAKHNETDIEEEDLVDMTKAELITEILELVEPEE